jgi:hypothetical protein
LQGLENATIILTAKKPATAGFNIAALRGIFLAMLHKHEIGDEIFDEALKIMIHGVVMQMFGGNGG